MISSLDLIAFSLTIKQPLRFDLKHHTHLNQLSFVNWAPTSSSSLALRQYLESRGLSRDVSRDQNFFRSC